MELWRSSLRALGTELAVTSVCSFACKAVLVALKYFELLREGSSMHLSLSTLLVEALPTLLTIALLMRYHARSAGAARATTTLSLERKNILGQCIPIDTLRLTPLVVWTTLDLRRGVTI